MFPVANLRSAFKVSHNQATFYLAVAALASLAIYILAFFQPANLFENYSRTKLGLQFLFSGGAWGNVQLVLAFASLGLLYLFSYRIVRQFQNKVSWGIVISASLLFALTMYLVAPFDAADIYDNIAHGRILGLYHANPYQQVILDYPQDPFNTYAAWKRTTSAYGPIWETLAGLAARWAGDDIIANVLIFKFLPGFFHFASVMIVWLILRRTQPEFALAGVLLLAWNPVVLYETWGNGHNDMVMVFWILAAIWMVNLRRYSLAVLSLIIGTLVKFIPLLLFPAALMAGLKDLRKPRDRYWFLLKTALAAIGIVLIAYFPFWKAGNLLSLKRHAHLFTTSIPAVLYKALRPTLGIDNAAYLVTMVTLCGLGFFVLYQTLRQFRSKPSQYFTLKAFNILAFYLMAACLWFQQWYGLWLISLAALLPLHARRTALFFGFWVITKQLIFGPVFVPQIVNRPEYAAGFEALLTLGVLGPTWIYALRSMKSSQQIRSVPNAV
jgi:hypothetical protein